MQRNSVLVQEIFEDLVRVGSQRARKIDEFDDVDSPFADLNSGNNCLRGLESRGNLLLRKSGRFSGGDQGRAQGSVSAATKGLQ